VASLDENFTLGSSGDSASGDGSTQGAEEKKASKSAATVLVEIAEELYEFGLSDVGETFAVPRSGPLVVRMLRGGKTSLRSQLAREYFRRFGKAAPQQSLADALLVVEGSAQDATERHLHQRFARVDGVSWLDLGDATGRAVRITGRGWSVVDRPPVLFKRTAVTTPLPEPTPGGGIAELWGWLNVSESDRPLLLAWQVSLLYPDMPHPVLGMFGEHGTGKTTAGKVMTLLLDPSPAAMGKPPRDAEQWVNTAAVSSIVGMDNVSAVPDWLSDSICRAVTGTADVRRRLYTDADTAVFAFRRGVVLAGIDLGALNGDLADRMLPLTLEAIGEAARLTEEELWFAWGKAHPRLLGALLDLAASVIDAVPFVRLESKPRMADYARVLAAVDRVLGTGGAGLRRYRDKQGEMAGDSLTDDPFVAALADAYAGRTFTGSSADLRAALTPADEKWKPPKGWPDTARKVTQRLKRQAPVMRKAGWVADHDDGANHTNRVQWTITPPASERGRETDSQSSRDSQQGADQRERDPESASVAASVRETASYETRACESADTRDSQPNGDVSAGHDATASVASAASHEYGQSQGAGHSCRLCHRHDGWAGWPEADLCTVCAGHAP
jgi:hypothetical protein